VADAYLSVRGWTMGLAWVNGFNLGWYWPARGPANTMCARRPPGTVPLCEVRLGTGWAFSRAHGTCTFSGGAELSAVSGSAARPVPKWWEHFARAPAASGPGSAFGGCGVRCWAAQLRRRRPQARPCARARRYVPGPVLRPGKNEVILLEVEHAPEDATGARPSPCMPACLRVEP
jgi:hypothetical protein